MKKLGLIYLLAVVAVGLNAEAEAQIASPGIDSVRVDSSVLVAVTLPPAGAQTGREKEEEKETFRVVPWEFHAPLNASLAATDSTLRWQIWPDWTYKLNREPGVISYRMGTSIRNNAVQYHAHEPRHQQLYWEGISMNDPVSGVVDWALIPQHKVSEFYTRDLGTQYRSSYYLRQYYLNKPLSRLIYSESKFTHRNLEFEVSHNISRRTNVELSYWDRRTGGEYPNSEITGRQIYGKISHHLDPRRYLKLNYINNNYDIGRPLGYNIPNMLQYNFDRFTTGANSSSGLSRETSNLLALNFYQRSSDSTVARDNLHAGVFYRGSERLFSYSADTTAYEVGSAGINASKWWTLGGLSLQASAGYEYFFNKEIGNRSLTAPNWSQLDTEGRLSLDYIPIIDIEGGAAFSLRSDGFQSYRFNASADISLGKLSLKPGLSRGTVMPTPQQLYWQSEAVAGNSALDSEKIEEARGTLSFAFSPDAKVGVRAQHKEIRDGIMVVDSVFSNVSNYASQSATAFFDLDLKHFEFNGSATVHRYADSFIDPSGAIPMDPAERIWLKGGAYWKGYLFDRATYVKAGLSGMMSPFRYQAADYKPELNYWQPVSDDQRLPVFNRLDVDISARVRSIVFLLRWENVLDDVNQLGYFETAQYPMSQRRFIFGVRALFRN